MGKLFLMPLEICLLIYLYGSRLIKKQQDLKGLIGDMMM